MATLDKHRSVESRLLWENFTPGDVHLSILIPTFRRPTYLREALLSVSLLEFSFSYEVVVVDNDLASSNVTREVLAEFESLHLRLFANVSNLGMIGNWNRCLVLASGTYLTILNDDDLLLDGWVKNVGLAANSTAMVGCLTKRFEEFDQKILRRDVQRIQEAVLKPLKIKSFFLGLWTNGSLGTVFHRESCIALGGFNDDIFPISDWDFYVRYFLSYGGAVVEKQLTGYRWAVNEARNPDTIKKYIQCNEEFRKKLTRDGNFKRPSLYRFISLIVKIKMVFHANKLNSEIRFQDVSHYLEDISPIYLPLRWVPMKVIKFVVRIF